MINHLNLFSKRIMLSVSIFFLPIFMGYGMELDQDDIFEQFLLPGQTYTGFNMLENLPHELLHRIIMFLPYNDSGSKYLRKYFKHLHKMIPLEFATTSMRNTWYHFVGKAKSAKELNRLVLDQYKALEENFVNYNVLNVAYNELVLTKLKEFNEQNESLFLLLSSDIEQGNLLNFRKILMTIKKAL